MLSNRKNLHVLSKCLFSRLSTTGSPKPDMRWLVNGVIKKNCTKSHARSVDTTCLWVIKKVKMGSPIDEYTCEAVSIAGTDEKKVQVQVQGNFQSY